MAKGCFVPPQHAGLKWHVLRWLLPTGYIYERAEWVECAENGPTEGGHWLRWGRTGDFPSLCKCEYVGPAIDQESPYTHPEHLDDVFEPLPEGEMEPIYNPESWKYERRRA